MNARKAQRTVTKSSQAPEASPPPRTGWHSGLPPGIFIFLAVTAFYIWTATSSQYAFVWGTKKADHYNLLAEGFLSGHLYLKQEPSKEMLALKDPLDPVANWPYRLHDASLYKGRYYIYFGPVPVLTLYLPWRVIAGWSIPNNLAVILFLLAGYLFSCLLLFVLLRACEIHTSWMLKRVSIIALGLCQTAPIILRRGYMYETAVASGFCFFVAGAYFLARFVVAEKPVHWHAALGGLLLGLTPGCRPNYAIVAALGLAAYLGYLRFSRHLTGRLLLRETLWFGGPIAACGLLLAWYNFARFDNPLEFGQAYQLVGTLADRGIASHLSSFLPGLYKFLIQMPLRFPHFPFVELPALGPFGATEWPTNLDHVEPISGLLAISPLCLAGCLLPWFLYRWWSQTPPPVRFTLIFLYAAALANLVGIVMVVNQVSQRYEIDFAPVLLLISLFTLLWLAERLDSTRLKRVAAATLIVGVLASSALQAALSIDGYDNGLIDRNLFAYNQLATFFGDDGMSIRRVVFRLSLQGEISLSQQAAGTREAFLTTGVRGRSNAIVIEYLGEGRVKFGFYMSGKAIAYGPEITIASEKNYRIHFNYVSNPASLKLLLDDVVALDSSSAFFYPTSFSHATVGRNEIGELPGLAPFSGQLSAPAGLQFAAAIG